MNEDKGYILNPPPILFRDKVVASPLDKLPEDQRIGKVADWVEVYSEGGIYVFTRDFDMPDKTFVNPVQADAINTVKKATILILLTLAISPFSALSLISTKVLNKVLATYGNFTEWVLKNGYLDKRFYCNMCREIFRVADHFKPSLPIVQVVEAIALMFEADNAYRWFVQDFFGILNEKRFIKYPLLEFRRAIKEVERRQKCGIGHKIRAVRRLGTFLLLIPRYRKLARELASVVKWEEIRFDDVDRFWLSFRTDYDFYGLNQEERDGWREEIKLKFGPFFKEKFTNAIKDNNFPDWLKDQYRAWLKKHYNLDV